MENLYIGHGPLTRLRILPWRKGRLRASQRDCKFLLEQVQFGSIIENDSNALTHLQLQGIPAGFILSRNSRTGSLDQDDITTFVMENDTPAVEGDVLILTIR